MLASLAGLGDRLIFGASFGRRRSGPEFRRGAAAGVRDVLGALRGPTGMTTREIAERLLAGRAVGNDKW